MKFSKKTIKFKERNQKFTQISNKTYKTYHDIEKTKKQLTCQKKIVNDL